MTARIEYDIPNRKFRIRMETCDVVYSPWTSEHKLAWVHYGTSVLIAVLRTRMLEHGEQGIELHAGEVYRVASIEKIS